MAIIANVNRDPKRRSEPFMPDDFNPYAERAQEPPALRVPTKMGIRMIAQGFGAKIDGSS